jgi:hypothetical protein
MGATFLYQAVLCFPNADKISPVIPRKTRRMNVWQPCWCGSRTTRQRASVEIRTMKSVAKVDKHIQTAHLSPRRTGITVRTTSVSPKTEVIATGYGAAYAASIAGSKWDCARGYAGAASAVYRRSRYAAAVSPIPIRARMPKPSTARRRCRHKPDFTHLSGFEYNRNISSIDPSYSVESL